MGPKQNHPVEPGPAEEVVSALAVGGNPRRLEGREHGPAGQGPPPLQRAFEDPFARGKIPFVQAELAVPGGAARDHAGSEEGEHPADVRGGDKVQGAPERPRENDPPPGDRPVDVLRPASGRRPTDHWAPA